MKKRNVVLAYITQRDRLLVFRHVDFPEAGIQVPGGTQNEHETPEEAVVREGHEETGLRDLRLDAFLSEYDLELAERDETCHCRCYHLLCPGQTPETWRHWETDPADGSAGPIAFEFFWARLPDHVPHLAGKQSVMLPQLVERLSQQAWPGPGAGGSQKPDPGRS